MLSPIASGPSRGPLVLATAALFVGLRSPRGVAGLVLSEFLRWSRVRPDDGVDAAQIIRLMFVCSCCCLITSASRRARFVSRDQARGYLQKRFARSPRCPFANLFPISSRCVALGSCEIQLLCGSMLKGWSAPAKVNNYRRDLKRSRLSCFTLDIKLGAA